MISAEVIIPSPALQPFVHHYWVMKTSEMNLSQIIMPLGCMKWIFHRKNSFDINRAGCDNIKASIVGIYDKAIRIRTSDEIEMITVFFHPHTAKMIMDIPSNEFSNQNIEFDNVGNIKFHDLKEQVFEAKTIDDCITLIENFILKLIIDRQNPIHLKSLFKVFELMKAKPDVRIAELANAACLSERQFRRIFIENVGMTPKQIQRIQRFHLATNEILLAKEDSIENILYKYGYTDYSHFNREFHEIAGISPTQYAEHLKEVKKDGFMPIYKSYHTSK